MPSSEHKVKLGRFNGDKTKLGEAENFLFEMLEVRQPQVLLSILTYKQSLPFKLVETKSAIKTLENACDDVKLSHKLKVLLGLVLKVGNQLNGDPNKKVRAFTLDSLLKLSHTKAFNSQITVLHYLVKLIMKNNKEIIDFKAELEHVYPASRISLDQIKSELKQLGQGLEMVSANKSKIDKKEIAEALEVFVKKAGEDLKLLQTSCDDMKNKFESVLKYFGEKMDVKPDEFFKTLDAFCTAFDKALKEVTLQEQAKTRKEGVEKKKDAEQKAKQDRLRTRMKGRRMSVI